MKKTQSKVGKKQLTPISGLDSNVTAQIQSLTIALKAFTKKTGAGLGKHDRSESSMLGLIEAFSASVIPLQLAFSFKIVQVDVRVQMILIRPWMSLFDRLLSDCIRILNDRVSIIWRKNYPTPLESACSLHDDLSAISTILNKILSILTPKQITLTQAKKTRPSPSSSTLVVQSSSVIIDSRICHLAKDIVIRARHQLQRTIPSLVQRVESLIASRLTSSIERLAESILTKNSFVVSQRSKELSLGFSIRDTILKPMLLYVKSYCRSRISRERVMTVALNTSVDQVLFTIKEKRLRFNETGVFSLFAQLDCLLQWVITCKAELGIPPSTSLIIDQSPWIRANSILQVLLASCAGLGDVATTGSVSPGKDSKRKYTRHLTIFEYERWSELGSSPRWCVKLKCIGTRGVVSVSPVLEIRDL